MTTTAEKMKTTLNATELRELDACEEGYQVFIEAHNSDTVTLSQALDSNGWNDIWWFIAEAYEQFSQEQKNDLHLIGCDWAERTLENFEKEFPDDKRPRKAIEAKRAFVKGEISEEELSAAWSAARSAAEFIARSAAKFAAKFAARSAAEFAARSAAWSAARSAAEFIARSAAKFAARSAAESTEFAARSAAESAAESTAWFAAMDEITRELRDLFVKWEKEGCCDG